MLVCPNPSEGLNIESIALCEMAEIPKDSREMFEKLLFILFFLVVDYRDRHKSCVSFLPELFWM